MFLVSLPPFRFQGHLICNITVVKYVKIILLAAYSFLHYPLTVLMCNTVPHTVLISQ